MSVTIHQGSEKVVLTCAVDYDLTGIGTLTVNFGRGDDTWVGAGTTAVTAAGAGASTFTYTSNADFPSTGEQRLQARLRYADGRDYYTSWGELTINPSFGV